MTPCPDGEIGKHSRLKICRPQGLAGSIPARGTTSSIAPVTHVPGVHNNSSPLRHTHVTCVRCNHCNSSGDAALRITMNLRALIRTSIEPGILRAVEAPSAVQKAPLDALVLVTEWKQCHQPYLRRTHASVRIPVMFNARNFYDAKQLVGQAFL
jgi:hypothetical protein